jgi:hypothetical protein
VVLEQRAPPGLGIRILGERARPCDRELADLPRPREPGREMRRRRTQRARKLWILGDLDAAMTGCHRAKVYHQAYH